MELFESYKKSGIHSIDNIFISLYTSLPIGNEYTSKVLKVNMVPTELPPYNIGRFFEKNDGVYEINSNWRIVKIKEVMGLAENTTLGGVLNCFSDRDLGINIHPEDVEYCIAKLVNICSRLDPRIIGGEEGIEIKHVGKREYDLETMSMLYELTKDVKLSEGPIEGNHVLSSKI